MKRFYQLTLAITTVFTLVIGTSHFAFAQGDLHREDSGLLNFLLILTMVL